MEYLCGRVEETDGDTITINVEWIGSEALSPPFSSKFILLLEGHPFIAGDYIRMTVEKVNGCTDNGTETTGKLEGQV